MLTIYWWYSSSEMEPLIGSFLLFSSIITTIFFYNPKEESELQNSPNTKITQKAKGKYSEQYVSKKKMVIKKKGKKK
ncbi:hypothetical protein QWY81_10325 [Polaribacter undariae]|uniref:Uncharacterized protein n=1 Tax=Polaribacter sejongensis TaxID=985043 RepID=A0AAJ1QWY1_9FLAO|nr:hypothetical protein [Polaribacter undariae]MDN3619849.1 hypothetical protein [Polaribacter undariae]UWD31611.1 hypothetical protein NQP51_15935 [Polaribacter undariae]